MRASLPLRMPQDPLELPQKGRVRFPSSKNMHFFFHPSVTNICTDRRFLREAWVREGKGKAGEFDAYWKGLDEETKEVWRGSSHIPHY